LAAVMYAAAGRHPVAGIAAAFAGVSGGFSANLLPGQLDALLFGITQAATATITDTWTMNLAGNWWFIAAMLFVFLPVIWYVTDRIIEPRLGPWTGGNSSSIEAMPADDSQEGRGLKWAGIVGLGIVLLWIFLTFGPGNALMQPGDNMVIRLTPMLQSLVAGFFILFLSMGWVYGSITGTIKTHRDVVKMMADSMGHLAYYLVLAFAAAHFVALFNWTNLGLIVAVKGADLLRASGLPAPALLAAIVLMASFVNLLVGSASAKWALLAPVLVPMLMLLNISPEMTTAAYRVGDGATNIITPLMVYFPLILTFAQRWMPQFGLGSLTATMLPYSMGLLGVGLVLTMLWVALDLPPGPGASVEYFLPAG
jgi:aminobenzoyl-glutamate transport protein